VNGSLPKSESWLQIKARSRKRGVVAEEGSRRASSSTSETSADCRRRLRCAKGLGLRIGQFMKFCLVGGSGVLVDMAVLYLLADPATLAWNLTAAKVCSAEGALLNNFCWNEVWTFRAAARRAPGGWLRRLVGFHAICGVGIGLAVLLLHLFHTWLGFNVYIANLLAIFLVTLWNFSMNAACNWRVRQARCTTP
jgi:dolichol-phosphate mannosyltransferase